MLAPSAIEPVEGVTVTDADSESFATAVTVTFIESSPPFNAFVNEFPAKAPIEVPFTLTLSKVTSPSTLARRFTFNV